MDEFEELDAAEKDSEVKVLMEGAGGLLGQAETCEENREWKQAQEKCKRAVELYKQGLVLVQSRYAKAFAEGLLAQYESDFEHAKDYLENLIYRESGDMELVAWEKDEKEATAITLAAIPAEWASESGFAGTLLPKMPESHKSLGCVKKILLQLNVDGMIERIKEKGRYRIRRMVKVAQENARGSVNPPKETPA